MYLYRYVDLRHITYEKEGCYIHAYTHTCIQIMCIFAIEGHTYIHAYIHTYTHTHMYTGHVDLRHRTCEKEGCQRQPSFAGDGNIATRCRYVAHAYMYVRMYCVFIYIYACLHTGVNEPSFAGDGDIATRCRYVHVSVTHAYMYIVFIYIYICVCVCGWKRQPSFAGDGNIATRCRYVHVSVTHA
jgi:hypothetical protein